MTRTVEFGPSDVSYKTGDCVIILGDCPEGWQRDDKVTGYSKPGYSKRIRYYEGEIIRLQEGEWLGLGTDNIKPVHHKKYVFYKTYGPKHRIFACGVKRRFGYWWQGLREFVKNTLYSCVEIPCALVAMLIEPIFKLPGLRKLEPVAGIIVLLALLAVLVAVCSRI